MGGKFLYFAYGSNLLQKRIHINNPSAVRAGIGKLKVSGLKIECQNKTAIPIIYRIMFWISIHTRKDGKEHLLQ